MPWNPDVYNRFQSERFAPFDDLIKLVAIRDQMRVVDLGCGSGELTRRLADFLPDSTVVGIDSSKEMLSRTEASVRPGLRFESLAIEDVSGEWDLVFSHAAIQWVDEHEKLVPRLLSMVAPGGQLVVQLPSNHGHISQVVVREIAGEKPFDSILGGWTRISPVLDVVRYAELLYQHGGRELNVFEKVYPYVLEDSDDVVSWMCGTVLVPYFEKLTDAQRDEFLALCRSRLKSVWPKGPVFYGFNRILFSATHGAIIS